VSSNSEAETHARAVRADTGGERPAGQRVVFVVFSGTDLVFFEGPFDTPELARSWAEQALGTGARYAITEVQLL